MGKLLSHSEIESLLSAAASVRPHAEWVPHTGPEPAETPNWESHDLREPAPLPRDVFELLLALQAGLCQQLARRFNSLLRSIVTIRPVGLNQMRFNECESESTSSNLVCQITCPTQPAPWLISWQPHLAHSLINRLMGGAMYRPDDSPTEAPSVIEARLLNRLCLAVLDELGPFAGPFPLGPPYEVTLVPSPPRPRPDRSGTSCVCASFEIACDGVRGLMHCWLPTTRIAREHHAEEGIHPRTAAPGLLATQTQYARIELTADLANLRLRVSDLAELAIGDVLMTEIIRLDGATLRVADRALYRVAIGTLTGKKAVRLAKPLLPGAVSVSIDEFPKRT